MSIRAKYITEYGDIGIFNFPTGMLVDGSNLFVCDRQNNKVKVYDFDFTLISEFGDESILPEDICKAGDYYYVTDSENSRVLVYDSNLDFVSGNGLAFDYPSGITTDGTYLYIIGGYKVYQLTLYCVPVNDFGFYGESLNKLNYPYSLEHQNGNLYIADSANNAIKVYTTGGTYLKYQTLPEMQYPAGIVYYDGVFIITDSNAHIVYIFSETLQLLKVIYLPEMFFPKGVAVSSEYLFIADSGNNRILKYQLVIESESRFENFLNTSVESLYPTGRAFMMKKGGIKASLHEAFNLSISRVYAKSVGLLHKILPDSDIFPVDALERWENIYGILPYGSFGDRLAVLKQRFSWPDNKLARASASFIQEQMQLAGFDVYVTYNRFELPSGYSANSGNFNSGGANSGGLCETPSRFERQEPAYGWTEICANYLDAEKDASIFDDPPGLCSGSFNSGGGNSQDPKAIDREYQLRGTLFIHGPEYPDIAEIESARKPEFRHTILRLLPAEVVALLYVNYI